MDLQDYNLYTFFRIYVWSIDQDGARGCVQRFEQGFEKDPYEEGNAALDAFFFLDGNKIAENFENRIR